jgi:hypothetical protein
MLAEFQNTCFCRVAAFYYQCEYSKEKDRYNNDVQSFSREDLVYLGRGNALRQAPHPVHAGYSRINTEIFTRVFYAVNIPLSFLAAAGDGLIGLIPAVVSVIPRCDPHHQYTIRAFRQFYSCGRIFSSVYENLMHVVNPRAQFDIHRPVFKYEKDQKLLECFENEDLMPIRDVCGQLFVQFLEIYHKFNTYTIEDGKITYKYNPLQQHVYSRVSYVLAGIQAAVVQIVTLPLGFLAAVFSLLNRGRSERLNRMASEGLTIGNLLPIIYLTALGIISRQPLPFNVEEWKGEL